MVPESELPGLSEAELSLLKILWDAERATVRELHYAVEAAGHEWAYTTVQTMLSRMEEKGYVRVDRSGFAHIFEPAVSRRSLVGQRLDELSAKLCDGALGPLLLHLTEGRRFTADEIQQFRSLLDKAESDTKRKRGRR